MPQTTASPTGNEEAVQAILSRAGTDRAFRSRLLEHPADTLRAGGVPTWGGLELRPVDPDTGTAYIVLPAPPAEGEVADGDLAAASGGVTPATVVMAIAVQSAISFITVKA